MIFAPLFYGQGGIWTSFGIKLTARRLRAMGIDARTYRYKADYWQAHRDVEVQYALGRKIGGVGYSLGCSALTLMQRDQNFDLVICLAGSSLAINYPISHKTTKHSVLVHGPDFLSDAGTKLGFDEMFYTPQLHLMIDFDPSVTQIILNQFNKLK